MKKIISVLSLAFFFTASCFADSVLNAKVLKKVKANVFEVVVEKVNDENIEYEKELPVSRISFQERNDNYLSIGTAFLMTDGKFYTAAHVIQLTGESYYKNYFIRDGEGKVYPIGNIESFATNRDFIKFDVPDFVFEKGMGLSYSTKFSMDSKVFSVGNALGEGVVVRNGTLTSTTFENKKGEWKWLRFTAAASPGNSGGPLITPDGTVIGIITMKSENENLNYALPIGEVFNIPENTGIVRTDYFYVIPNILSEKFYFEVNVDVELPKKYEEINQILTSEQDKAHEKIIAEIRTKYAPDGTKSFINTTDASSYLYESYRNDFPAVNYINQNGNWILSNPNDIKTQKLADNGYIKYGSLMGYVFAKIRKPDSVKLQDMIDNPKIYNDMVIQTTYLYRNYAGEKIAITSLGEPVKVTKYVDFFGRTWTVSYYDIKFADSMMITYALPIPNGMFVFYGYDTRSTVLSCSHYDMQFIADYSYIYYIASLKNWREYVSVTDEVKNGRNEMEKAFDLQENDNEIVFKTDSAELKISKADFNIDDKTTLYATSGYYYNGAALTFESRNVGFYTDSSKEDYTSYYVAKCRKPYNLFDTSLIDAYQKLLNRVSPYDEVPYNDETLSVMNKIVYDEKFQGEEKYNCDKLYVYSIGINKQNAFDEVKEKFGKLESNTTVVK